MVDFLIFTILRACVNYYVNNYCSRHLICWPGHIAGCIMANRKSNIERYKWVVRLLGQRPTECVLKLGYGPGEGIDLAAKQLLRLLLRDNLF